MLSVAIQHQNKLHPGAFPQDPQTGFQSGALALVRLVPDHLGARRSRHSRRLVGGPVIHHQHPVDLEAGSAHHVPDVVRFEVGGNQGRHVPTVEHRKPRTHHRATGW